MKTAEKPLPVWMCDDDGRRILWGDYRLEESRNVYDEDLVTGWQILDGDNEPVDCYEEYEDAAEEAERLARNAACEDLRTRIDEILEDLDYDDESALATLRAAAAVLSAV